MILLLPACGVDFQQRPVPWTVSDIITIWCVLQLHWTGYAAVFERLQAKFASTTVTLSKDLNHCISLNCLSFRLTTNSTPANAFGLSETHGNVEEWTLDWSVIKMCLEFHMTPGWVMAQSHIVFFPRCHCMSCRVWRFTVALARLIFLLFFYLLAVQPGVAQVFTLHSTLSLRSSGSAQLCRFAPVHGSAQLCHFVPVLRSTLSLCSCGSAQLPRFPIDGSTHR